MIFIIMGVTGCVLWAFPEYFREDKKLSHPSGIDYRSQSPDFEIVVTYELITAIYGGAW